MGGVVIVEIGVVSVIDVNVRADIVVGVAVVDTVSFIAVAEVV